MASSFGRSFDSEKKELDETKSVSESGVHFFIKQGCSLRKLRAADEMATLASQRQCLDCGPEVLVKGIKTFRCGAVGK